MAVRYRLIDVVEVEDPLGEGEWLALRLEVFKKENATGTYRCRLWKLAFLRVQEPFELDEDQKRGESDEVLIIELGSLTGLQLMAAKDFESPSDRDAIEQANQAVDDFLSRKQPRESPNGS